jgi:AraC-like DNA-binding protein
MNVSKSTPPVRETQFDNERLSKLGIEWLTLSELRRRVPPQSLLMPERLDFFVVLLVTEGVGTHRVDFVQGQLSPGSLVFVRPGQIQQWSPGEQWEGSLILITAQALLAGSTRSAAPEIEGLPMDEWPAVAQLPASLVPEIAQAMARLQLDFERFDNSALDAALIRLDARSLLMRLGRWFASQADKDPAWSGDRATYRLFTRALESSFQQRLGVKDYAARLGYSESTLTRACLAAEGRSAKQVIDRRVALEAARQLVHSQISVAEIGHGLGFSEATNFVKFFGRMNGASPQAFRQQMAIRASAQAVTQALSA